jgi:hypothetical protein
MARIIAAGSPRKFARKFELAVLVLIVSLLALVLMGAIESARESVEEATVQSEAAALRVELLDFLAHREAFGGQLPQSANPLRWVAREPAAYLGELDVAPIDRGVWYFDRRQGDLVYRFRGPREARFRLERGAAAAGAQGSLAGIGLRRVDAAAAEVNSSK